MYGMLLGWLLGTLVFDSLGSVKSTPPLNLRSSKRNVIRGR